MKHSFRSIRTFLLPAVLCLSGGVAGQQTAKVKPAVPAAPPTAQQYATAAPTRTAESADQPTPYGLRVIDIDNKAVKLGWTSAEPTDGFFEDFEEHSDFVINSPGSIGWTYFDQDNEDTYTWTAAAFPNQGQKMAFIVMNPSKTVPSTEAWPNIQPYSGKKFLAAFTVDGGNNDYIVSPELNFSRDFQFSFQAKSYTEQYGLERIRVGYSTGGNRPSDFVFVQEGDYEEVAATWELKSYTIPKEAKYVCINCVSQEAFILMLDDIFIGTNAIRPRIAASNPVKGFRLFRDGAAVNDEPLTSVYATDTVPDYGHYTYSVQALLTDGTTSDVSEPLEVEVPDIRLLPFFDSFDSNILDTDNWNVDEDEQGNENKWGTDYYPYGLVDPALTYCYSRLTDYSQSAISKELRTTTPDNTRLRFELRLENDTKSTADTLAVEISTDGTTWQSIDKIGNDGGSFNWRVHEYDLSPYLDGAELFRIRFRAFGADAYYINYWYVDDIKVWNPIWATALLTVQQGGRAMADCPVQLTADHGAVIDTTTDAEGHILFDKIEQGTWQVNIIRPDCNVYSSTWIIGQAEGNTFTAAVTAPLLQPDKNELAVEMTTESTHKETLSLHNAGDGGLDWHLTPLYAAGSGQTDRRWKVQQSFDASGDIQSSVAFDGEYYYTASWYYLGKYFKYDRNGQFIEEFNVPGMYYKLYDLAFDGTYFYGSDYSNVIFQLDLRNKRLVREITIDSEPSLKITHCAYDSDNDQFWVGTFTNIGRVDRNGKVTVSFRNISNEQEMSVYGAAYDNVTPGGPYLWMANEVVDGINEVDNVQIAQYNVGTMRLTGVTHSAIDIPGYKVGSATRGANNICGLSTTTSIEDGSLSLVGCLQQSPSRIFAYRLCDAGTWLEYSPKSGHIQAGDTQDIDVTYHTLNTTVGQTEQTTLRLHTNPETGVEDIPVRVTATTESTTPRPTELTATLQDNSTVALTWKNEGAAHFLVYRNNELIATLGAESRSYVDTQLIRGTYTYTVKADYEACTSLASEPAEIFVQVGAAYFAPLGLTATLSHNSDVALTWQLPTAGMTEAATLRWDNGENSDAIGLIDGGYFWIGNAFTAEDLTNRRGMVLDSVSLFVNAHCQSLTLQIFKDGKRITSQKVSQTLTYGAYNIVALASPVTIEYGHDYIVSFLVSHLAGIRPVGVDGSSFVEAKGNLMSTDGKTWVPSSYLGFENGNFNMAIHLSPGAQTETLPIGYHVFCDGEQLTIEPVSDCNYADVLSGEGTHLYEVASVYADGGQSARTDAVEVRISALGTPQAPSLLRAEVEHNSTVSLRWNIPLAEQSSLPVDISKSKATCRENYPEYVFSFKGAVNSEFGIASDGEHLYTSVYSSNGIVNRYSLDGNFEESICVDPYLSGIRNLTYDGQDFYAVNTDASIYRLNLAEPAVADTIVISEIGRHIAYVPTLAEGKGGFEVGDWETSIYVSKNGAKLGNGPVYKGASGTAYYDGTLYAFEQGYEHPYTICRYNQESGRLLQTIDLKEYEEVSPVSGSTAGGLSIVQTKEGLKLLAAALQEPTGTRFFFFDLGSVPGLTGYNVYRNGEKVNETPIPYRYFAETQTRPGTYTYEVETVYIDGTTSARSQEATVEILEAGLCNAPVDVKARTASYGYDAIISFVDPTSLAADIYESAELTEAGEAFEGIGWDNPGGAWKATAIDAWQGEHSLTCDTYDEARLTLSTEEQTEDFSFAFVARNTNDLRQTTAAIKILVSASGDNSSDYRMLATVSPTEAWQQYSFDIPAGTTHIQLLHESGTAAVLLDALSVGSDGTVYAYDIYRNGEKINDTPVSGVSYIDRNLPCGDYTYAVSAYYESSCASERSEEVALQVRYDASAQAPGPLTVEPTDKGNLLRWSAPALGDAQTLSWHSGTPHAAAGMPSGGAYWAGVLWPTENLRPYASRSLSEVEVYINQLPDALFLLVYEGDELVHSQFVPSLRQYSYNRIPLSRPLPINSERNLKVVVYVEHNEISVPIGYDEGPAKTGRGDLYSSDGVTWETLTDNNIDGNWNISLLLKAYADAAAQTEPTAAAENYLPQSAGSHQAAARLQSAAMHTTVAAIPYFVGYNIYCNSEQLNTAPYGETSYLDCEEHVGRYYEYQVAATYSDGTEQTTDKVRILATGLHTADGTTATLRTTGTHLCIEGLPEGADVYVYNAAGQLQTRRQADHSQCCIDTYGWPEGIYVVRAAGLNAKFSLSR
ncbi:MAG: choice-of-anchor J domain-containing protein [Alloprevotella sp.]